MSGETYSTKEVAALACIDERTARVWAARSNVAYIGEGRRKSYQWTRADIDRFNDRRCPGRPRRED
jgi:hypothetical protein